MKKKKLIIGAAAAVLLGGIIVFRFMQKPETDVASAVPAVVVEKPSTGSIYVETGLTGSIEPADSVSVIPKAAGEVTEVAIRAGDVVQEGQKLVHIDTKMVDSARISRDSAQIAASDAATNLSRMQALAAAGDISQQQLEQASSSARTAALQLESAKLNLKNQMEYSDITAPITGRVESVSVEVHDNVSQQNVICVISGEGSKIVSFNVTDRIVKNLNVGDRIRVEKQGKEFYGQITEISSMVDSQTGLFKVKASMDGADDLATGATVKLYVVGSKAENVMTIPTDCIYYNGGQAQVYTVDEDNTTVHLVPVTVGVYDSKNSEILDGIDMDSRVIQTWTSELFEGAKVQIAESAAAQEKEADGNPETGSSEPSAEETSQAGQAK